MLINCSFKKKKKENYRNVNYVNELIVFNFELEMKNSTAFHSYIYIFI